MTSSKSEWDARLDDLIQDLENSTQFFYDEEHNCPTLNLLNDLSYALKASQDFIETTRDYHYYSSVSTRHPLDVTFNLEKQVQHMIPTQQSTIEKTKEAEMEEDFITYKIQSHMYDSAGNRIDRPCSKLKENIEELDVILAKLNLDLPQKPIMKNQDNIAIHHGSASMYLRRHEEAKDREYNAISMQKRQLKLALKRAVSPLCCGAMIE